MKPLLIILIFLSSCQLPTLERIVHLHTYVTEQSEIVLEYPTEEQESLPLGYLAIVDDQRIIFENVYDNATDYNQSVHYARLDIENSNRWHGTSWQLITGGSP